ncbi:unnamed protein product [Paramecium octaurelia]|uniref:Uncharacterized protein n=1 Tax=Paramecium octaurelia TaxID=43137 RepID=A0A8S1UVF8_PAROT|nr:unnamed protein product [Paramecium octaurelia]CAD8168406.1 unnamed protein product [Paramecium octaurelia]
MIEQMFYFKLSILNIMKQLKMVIKQHRFSKHFQKKELYDILSDQYQSVKVRNLKLSKQFSGHYSKLAKIKPMMKMHIEFDLFLSEIIIDIDEEQQLINACWGQGYLSENDNQIHYQLNLESLKNQLCYRAFHLFHCTGFTKQQYSIPTFRISGYIQLELKNYDFQKQESQRFLLSYQNNKIFNQFDKMSVGHYLIQLLALQLKYNRLLLEIQGWFFCLSVILQIVIQQSKKSLAANFGRPSLMCVNVAHYKELLEGNESQYLQEDFLCVLLHSFCLLLDAKATGLEATLERASWKPDCFACSCLLLGKWFWILHSSIDKKIILEAQFFFLTCFAIARSQNPFVIALREILFSNTFFNCFQIKFILKSLLLSSKLFYFLFCFLQISLI